MTTAGEDARPLPGSVTELALLEPAFQDLVHAARAARERAYCPYSGFHVGAALLAQGDPPRIITGANVENASYGATLCAERAAVARANAEGVRRFRAIAVAARASRRRVDGSVDPAEGVEVPGFTAPCGPCRQVLGEFASLAGRPLAVLLVSGSDDRVRVTDLDALLPGAFGPADLGVDLGRW